MIIFHMFLQDGRSALHYAAAFSRDDIVKLLINKKADATLLGGVSILMFVIAYFLNVENHSFR